MRYVATIAIITFFTTALQAQNDSTKVLDEVVVSAFRSNRPLMEVPASIGLVSTVHLERFSNTTLLPAVNTIPGVKMEERSPGSYRFSIRGSLLRSPFGVRNVKFYWNGMPLTDGGGNTYLNLIDFDAIGKMEIIKGPGASLYGAGTGGVVLLTTPEPASDFKLNYSLMGGSYGLLRTQLSGTLVSNEKSQLAARLSYQRSDGYREQTQMKRLSGGLDWNYRLNSRSDVSTTLLATQLYYGTPGGLTQAQMEQNPTQARPGAVDQNASVTNKTVYVASRYNTDWNDAWSSSFGLFASFTDFENWAIANFETREERNWGGRTETQYVFGRQWKGKMSLGAEYQQFYSPLSVYANNQGVQGNLREDDRLNTRAGLLFAQSDFDLPHHFFLTLGGSVNFLKYEFKRISVDPPQEQSRDFSPEFFPRVALLNKIHPSVAVFASVSDGFSPPSLAEVRPSNGIYNDGLKPERGINYEGGIRVNLFKNRLHLDVAQYYFRLRNAIVVQQTNNSDFFVNAGGTRQRGTEVNLSWTSEWTEGSVRAIHVALNASLTNYVFTQYVKNGIDLSSNQLTGVAPGYVSLQSDFTARNGFYFNCTVSYSDHTPLDDANSVYAEPFVVLGARLGYKSDWKVPFDLFGGIDNATDEKYSLGNDINAFGGRFFNPAPARNFYLGLRISIGKK